MTDIKRSIKSLAIRIANGIGLSSKYVGSPKGWLSVAEWTSKNSGLPGVSFQEIRGSRLNKHQLPATVDSSLHKSYASNATWQQPASFVACIPNGRVWGRNGAVISPDDLLMDDVSREFGRREGVFNKDHSIFKQVKLSRTVRYNATVAVIAASGSATYYHWMFDILPRIGLLKEAGVFDQVDLFVVDYTDLPFQEESLEVLGIPESKVLRCNNHWKFHIEAATLLVPSLTGRLSTISEWTIGFLRETFLGSHASGIGARENLYLSRKKAPSRRLLNEQEVEHRVLNPRGFREFFAEDYSIRETALIFSNADFIIGVHGSGFANLAFCNPGTKVIDIVAPRHVGPYFWFISDFVKADYGYLFGIGDRASNDDDLISNKVDHDILLDVEQLESLITLMKSEETPTKLS